MLVFLQKIVNKTDITIFSRGGGHHFNMLDISRKNKPMPPIYINNY